VTGAFESRPKRTKDAQRELKARQIADRRCVADGVDLSLDRSVDVGVLAEERDRPGEAGRRRLVTGDEQREHLVAHLAVVHRRAAALVVARSEKPREEILTIAGCATAIVDHALHALVEERDRARQLAATRTEEHRRPPQLVGEASEQRRPDRRARGERIERALGLDVRDGERAAHDVAAPSRSNRAPPSARGRSRRLRRRCRRRRGSCRRRSS
jgi:hypothetical protein